MDRKTTHEKQAVFYLSNIDREKERQEVIQERNTEDYSHRSQGETKTGMTETAGEVKFGMMMISKQSVMQNIYVRDKDK